MHSHNRWLLEQLPQWENDGLISSDAARKLREQYALGHAAENSPSGIVQIIMGGLGALLIGAGLIAVIGYNWDDFPRIARLLFAFLPLLATQIGGFIVLRRGDAAAAWVRETMALLQASATGGCIAIVSQIYNLGGEWPDFLFWWMLLSLPLVWVMRAQSVAIFYLIAIATWSMSQVEHGNPWHDSPLIYPLLLSGLLPYWPGWPPNRPLSISMRWVMTVSAIFGLCSAAVFVCGKSGDYTNHHFEAALWLWTVTAAVFVLLPLNQSAIAEPAGRKPQILIGALWLFGYGLAATFHDFDVSEGIEHATKLPWCWGLLAVLASFALLAVKQRRWAALSIAAIALLPLAAFPFGRLQSWVFTAYLAVIGLALIMLDLRGGRGAPRFGALLLSVLIILRMADSQFSLLAKGIGFIVVGMAFLAFNIFLGRRYRQRGLPSA
jgi:uncharacterized membrane protein